MTRKDYVLIARVLNECFNHFHISLHSALRDILISRFIAALAEANPDRFDAAKFRAACLKGIE